MTRYAVLIVLLFATSPVAPAAGPFVVDELLEAHLGVVPAKVGKLVRARAEGNPFYVEELVRHLLESGILGMSDDGYVLVREPRAGDLPGGVESLIRPNSKSRSTTSLFSSTFVASETPNSEAPCSSKAGILA